MPKHKQRSHNVQARPDEQMGVVHNVITRGKRWSYRTRIVMTTAMRQTVQRAANKKRRQRDRQE